MFYQTCDKQVTVGLTSIHNFIHNRKWDAAPPIYKGSARVPRALFGVPPNTFVPLLLVIRFCEMGAHRF